MKKLYRNLFALIPFCVAAAGCSDSEPKSELQATEGDFHVMMSVLPAGSQAADGSSTSVGTEDERAFDDDHIYFATYKRPSAGTSTYNGDYLTFIKDGNQLNNTGSESVEADYYTPNWGPSVSARLKKIDYRDGFAVGVFSVPANTMSTSFSVKTKTLSAISDIILKWPSSTVEGATAWAPNKSNGNHIPMGGVADVTAEYMKNYNENVYTGLSPFPLPNVQPMRAMAKVVIEDPEGLIAKAEMYTASNGCIIAAPNQLFGSDLSLVQPKVPTSRTFFTQQLKAPNGLVTDGGKTVNTYTFYSYEQSFRSPVTGTDLAADADGRKIVTLTSDPTKLKDASGNAVTLKVAIAPYDNGAPASITVGQLMVKDNGSWQGLMRNRVYTYTISATKKGTFSVQVKVRPWEKQTQDEEFEPVKKN